MKLLYVAPSAYLLGGVQDWLADLVEDQRRLGLNVTVAVPDDAIHRLDPYASRYPKLRPVAFRNPSGSEAGRIRALEHLLLAHPDHLVIGVNIASLFGAVRRMRLRNAFHGRLLMTLHAIEPDYFDDLREHSDVIDALVVTNRLSGALAKVLSQLPSQRIAYAPYGVAVPDHPPVASPAGQPQQPLRIAWVGRLEQRQKRVGDIAPILKALEASGTAFELTIAGEGPENHAVAKDLGHWIKRSQVKLLGAISRRRLHDEVYAKHDALLITSSWETGPIVAWEAMAAGVAVVSSRYVGSGLEGALQQDQTALLFPVGDCEAAAQQLIRLREPDLRRQLSLRGKDLVSRRYSRQASLNAWTQAFSAASALDPLPHPLRKHLIPASGRLDHVFGPFGAERIRRRLGLAFRHAQAGSEWPHSGHSGGSFDALLDLAASLEQTAPQPLHG